MADFYGTVRGGRGVATRLGHRDLHVTAQSYSGSIVVKLYQEGGETFASVCVSEGSTPTGVYNLYRGPIRKLFLDHVNFGNSR